ncbi:hypothetical protein ACTXT7_010912 [Hymenolepis weldensis]
MKHRRTFKSDYDGWRRKQLMEDNKMEEQNIKRLSKKLGLHNRKPRRDGTQKLPAWMRDSGLDYLFEYEKYDEKSSNAVSGEKIVGESKSNRKKSLNIFGQEPEESDDNVSGSEEMVVDSQDEDDLGSISEVDSEFEEEETVEDIKSNDVDKVELVDYSKKPEPKIENPNNEEVSVLRRSVRLILNCVSEAQMAKTISDLVALFSDRPRATVRKVLIEEIDILLAAFPLTRGQSVGWLQQELAACFVCTEARLHHIGDDSRLVAHFVEFFVSSKLPASTMGLKESEGGALASRHRFSSEQPAITGDLIMDLLEEFLKLGDLLALQIAHQIVKPISSILRREMHERCNKFLNSVKVMMSALDVEDLEKSVELEGIVSNLSSKHSKEPALSSADHFFKSIKNWNKGTTFPKELRLPLRLEELQNVKKGKGRWWAVGSAFSGDALKSSDPLATATNLTISSKKTVVLTPMLQEVAHRLGLITPMRQQLFAVLVSTPGGPDSTATALLEAVSSSGGGCGAGSKGSEHREREVVQIVIHCLVSEQPFNRFYTRVLGALLNHHRRFAMMVRCAFWDVMSKQELTKEAKCNAGKAIGILASVYDFPLTLLKKFNFGDESDANVGLLSSLVTELTSTAFKKTLEKFARVASDNPKLGRNLRIFIRRLSKTHPDEACRSYLTKLFSDLRDLFP